MGSKGERELSSSISLSASRLWVPSDQCHRLLTPHLSRSPQTRSHTNHSLNSHCKGWPWQHAWKVMFLSHLHRLRRLFYASIHVVNTYSLNSTVDQMLRPDTGLSPGHSTAGKVSAFLPIVCSIGCGEEHYQPQRWASPHGLLLLEEAWVPLSAYQRMRKPLCRAHS